MKKLILVLWMFSPFAFSQTVYQVNEVEKPAEPTGELSMLNQFISSNLQVPIRVASKGINSRVFVKGIIELDGSMTGLEIVRGIDSACDQEAIRLMTIYKAWKPALIKGQRVRQSLVYPLLFKISPISNFDSTLNALVYYYDEKDVATDQKDIAKRRVVLPVDPEGYVNQDILFQKQKRGGWRTTKTSPVTRRETFIKSDEVNQADSIAVTELTVQNEEIDKPFQELTLKKDGKLVSFKDYNASGSPTLSKVYYTNGVLKQTDEITDGKVLVTRWFNSGVLNSVTESSTGTFQMNSLVVKGVWDREGNPIVKDGNGWCKLPSEAFGGRSVWEEGMVAGSLKSGKWIGKLADSTIFFEEYYQAGILQKGTAYENGNKTEYQSGVQQPEFEGGQTGMYRFLTQNMRYPVNAIKSRITGSVLLSFVVCEDGSLCDYEVTKGVDRSLDAEALRVVKKMSGKWKPGVLRGRKVRVKYNLPVTFQM